MFNVFYNLFINKSCISKAIKKVLYIVVLFCTFFIWYKNELLFFLFSYIFQFFIQKMLNITESATHSRRSDKTQKREKSHKQWTSKNILSMNMSNCDGFGLIHRVIKLVEATNLEHGSQDGADGGDTELNGGGGSEREDFRYILCKYNCTPSFLHLFYKTHIFPPIHLWDLCLVLL